MDTPDDGKHRLDTPDDAVCEARHRKRKYVEWFMHLIWTDVILPTLLLTAGTLLVAWAAWYAPSALPWIAIALLLLARFSYTLFFPLFAAIFFILWYGQAGTPTVGWQMPG